MGTARRSPTRFTSRKIERCGFIQFFFAPPPFPLAFPPAGECGFVRAAAHTMSREINRPNLPARLSILEVAQEAIATHEVVFHRPHCVAKLQ